jgi:hypothetical protein
MSRLATHTPPLQFLHKGRMLGRLQTLLERGKNESHVTLKQRLRMQP